MVAKKSYLSLVIISLLILTIMTSVSAITGSIGNARMILRDVETGDTIERSILVKNVNDVSVDIELFAEGDLEDSIDIKDNNFRLEPQTEKKAYFTIKVKKPGTTETKINVKFTPIEGGNGVGLSSTIIIVAEKGPGFIEGLFNNNEEPTPNNQENPNENNNTQEKPTNKLKILLSITAIIFLILIIVLGFAAKKKEKEFKVEIKNTKLKIKETKKNEK
jgi:preprotein translocase subunit SecG